MRPGIEAVLAHDVSHELARDFLPRELAKFAQDTRVAPAGILAGQLDDQLADVDPPAPPGLTRLLVGLGFPQPAEKRVWHHDGNELSDGRPQWFSQPDQPAPLPWRYYNPLRQVSTQDLVLSFNELKLPDHVLELTSQGLVGQVGEKDKQRVENGLQKSI